MNLDNVFSKAKEVFETAYKKTGSVVAAGKHKLDINSLESKLSKDYEALGRLYFDAVSDGKEQSLKDAEGLIAEIGKKKTQIEEMRKNPPRDNEK